jgi:hypothetical protein
MLTEEEWLAGTHPGTLLTFRPGRATDRKMRLFGCACCRLIWEHLPEEWVRRAVETAERFADHLLDDTARDAARRDANQAVAGLRGFRARLAEAAADLLKPRVSVSAAVRVADQLQTGRTAYLLPARQCALLRDIMTNPFHPPGRLHPDWLTWRDGLVRQLAQAIYEERAFERMPILADALEDAGCSDAVVLGHLRGPGPHVPGCWLLDRLLDWS